LGLRAGRFSSGFAMMFSSGWFRDVRSDDENHDQNGDRENPDAALTRRLDSGFSPPAGVNRPNPQTRSAATASRGG
jgi:hypothetical protein